MVVQLVPWAVTGGALHSAAAARTAAFASTAGAAGIITPDSLKVSAFSTPGGGVNVGGGAAVLPSPYPGVVGESYVLRNVGTTVLAVEPTGATGRTDLVVARVLDPEFEGPPPADPQTFEYSRLTILQGVSAVPASYPAVALAKITIPPNTAVISASMITDLRAVANPLSAFGMQNQFPTSTEYLPALGGAYALRPAAPTVKLKIPDWATTLRVTVSLNGLVATVAQGVLQAWLKTYAGPMPFNTAYLCPERTKVTCPGIGTSRDYSLSPNLSGDHRVTSFRGQEISLGVAGVLASGGTVRFDADSQLCFQWQLIGSAS